MKIRFICVRFNCKRKKEGKNGWLKVPLKGGGGGLTLDGKSHENKHFFSPSLMQVILVMQVM